MANVVIDPREHPEVVLPDFSRPDPLVTFTLADVALVYGSKWKQRYFTKVGDDYFPLPAQWDVSHRVWRPYFVQPNTDWWVPFYPADNMKRPTGPLCDGCHSVNYNVQTEARARMERRMREVPWPGQRARAPARRIDHRESRATRLRAGERHVHPVPFAGAAAHETGSGPVLRLAGGLPPGRTPRRISGRSKNQRWAKGTFTHFADGTAHKNRMQGNDFVQSGMYTHGVTCFSCHDAHGTSNNADLIKPVGQLCLTCHGPGSPNGPREADHRGAHASRPGKRRQRMRRVSHAEDRADDRRRERAEPYVPLHHARR